MSAFYGLLEESDIWEISAVDDSQALSPNRTLSVLNRSTASADPRMSFSSLRLVGSEEINV